MTDNTPEAESVAQWMMNHGYATGHADTLDEMLLELEAQAARHPPEATGTRTKCTNCYGLGWIDLQNPDATPPPLGTRCKVCGDTGRVPPEPGEAQIERDSYIAALVEISYSDMPDRSRGIAIAALKRWAPLTKTGGL